MKTYKLFSVADLYFEYYDEYPWEPSEDFGHVTYTDDDNQTIDVAGGEDLIIYLAEKYPDFRAYEKLHAMRCERDGHIPWNAYTNLINIIGQWNYFINHHSEYSRIAKMLDRSDYDPLENYDRHEVGGWKDTTDDDATHSMSYAQQQTATVNDPKLKTKTTGSVYGDNSRTAVPDTESVTEPVRDNASDVDTITTTNAAHVDQSYVEGDVTVTREFNDYRVHGNIGVTTAAQMIEGEAKVRSRLVMRPMIYDAFAKEYLTLIEEVIV